ncbi:MAG TPA: DUF222 domain-containing protein, partial [Candidatus Nanopelagicales bacterium]
MVKRPGGDDERSGAVDPSVSGTPFETAESAFAEGGESAFEAEPAFEEVVLRTSDAEAEKAFAASLVELDRADREAGLLDNLDTAGPAPWDEAVVSDDELVASLGRSVHEADLMLLASIDPRDLSENLSGSTTSAPSTASRHGSHRCATTRSSRWSDPSRARPTSPRWHSSTRSPWPGAPPATPRARRSRLPAPWPRHSPGFAAALRAGEISDTHCSILVEKTRVVADETVLVEIERRVLPKARRLTAGEFAGEVATTIARLDRDAAARLKRARATRRVWARQLEDGMGYLGLTHDWSTIQAIHDAGSADGRCLQVQRGGTGAVADGVEDATADACRADALAARVLGQVHDDGSVSWDRDNVAVTVNVVIDLATLRGESDQIAILDGQPVPGQIGREIAQFATWWRRLVTDPVDGHLLDYGRTTYLPDKLRRFVLARDGACRTHYCT